MTIQAYGHLEVAGNPDGGGSSIVLCDFNADNSNGANWSVSLVEQDFVNSFEVIGSPWAMKLVVIHALHQTLNSDLGAVR